MVDQFEAYPHNSVIPKMKSVETDADKVLEYCPPVAILQPPVHKQPLVNLSMKEIGDLLNDPDTGKIAGHPMYAAWSEYGGPPQVWPGGPLPDGWSFHYDASKKEAWLEEPAPCALDIAKRRVAGKDIAEIVEDHEAEFRAPYGPTVVIGGDGARSESDSFAVARVNDGVPLEERGFGV